MKAYRRESWMLFSLAQVSVTRASICARTVSGVQRDAIMALKCAADKSLAGTRPVCLRFCSALFSPWPAGVQRDAIMALDCAADKSLARTHPFYLRICSASSAPRPAGVQRSAIMALDCAPCVAHARKGPWMSPRASSMQRRTWRTKIRRGPVPSVILYGV